MKIGDTVLFYGILRRPTLAKIVGEGYDRELGANYWVVASSSLENGHFYKDRADWTDSRHFNFENRAFWIRPIVMAKAKTLAYLDGLPDKDKVIVHRCTKALTVNDLIEEVRTETQEGLKLVESLAYIV
jgi:hypothetical protein